MTQHTHGWAPHVRCVACTGRNDSQATKDFWATIRREDRIANLRGEGHSEATIAAIMAGRACSNCGSSSHTFCNR